MNIRGTEGDLTDLAGLLTGKEAHITSDNGSFWLSSSLLEGALTHEEAVAAAQALVELLTGAVRTRLSWPGLTLGNVRDIPGQAGYLLVSARVAVRDRLSRHFGSGTPSQLDSVVDAAFSDEGLGEALQALARGEDWYDLYKVYEALGQANRIVQQRRAGGDECRRFRDTANHYRHRASRRPLPPNPMRLDEAQDFVRCLLRKRVALAVSVGKDTFGPGHVNWLARPPHPPALMARGSGLLPLRRRERDQPMIRRLFGVE